MSTFIQPEPSLALTRFAQWMWPAYARFKYGGMHVNVAHEVLSTFRRLKNQPTIVCPNHPAHTDPEILFALSAIVGEQFMFMTAREIFGASNSLTAKWLQMIGCYSIERGTTDVESLKATRRLLVEQAKKVIIFPEGEISHQSNHLLRFADGPEHVAFSALRELRRRKSNLSVYLLPLILYYSHDQDITKELFSLLAKLEQELAIEADQAETFTRRLQQALATVIDALLAEIGLTDRQSGITEKCARFRDAIINDAYAFLGLPRPAGTNHLSQLHLLRYHFCERFNHLDDQLRKQSRKFESLSKDVALFHWHQIKRAINLIAIDESSFFEPFTQEQAAQLLDIIDYEVRGRLTLPRPDAVWIGSAAPIDVGQYLDRYLEDKRNGVQALKAELAIRLSIKLSARQDFLPSQLA